MIMNEREIYLMELALEDKLRGEERGEFSDILNNNSQFKKEFAEQQKIKEALMKMSLKNPGDEFWDSYWVNIYNKLERGFAWVLILISGMILVGYGVYEAVSQLLVETELPSIIKLSIFALLIGVGILIYSLLREKIATGKRDKYKEIQR